MNISKSLMVEDFVTEWIVPRYSHMIEYSINGKRMVLNKNGKIILRGCQSFGEAEEFIHCCFPEKEARFIETKIVYAKSSLPFIYDHKKLINLGLIYTPKNNKYSWRYKGKSLYYRPSTGDIRMNGKSLHDCDLSFRRFCALLNSAIKSKTDKKCASFIK